MFEDAFMTVHIAGSWATDYAATVANAWYSWKLSRRHWAKTSGSGNCSWQEAKEMTTLPS